MTTFLAVLRFIIGILPALIEAVKAIEAAVPLAGQGAAKAEAVAGLVQAAYAAGDQADLPPIASAIAAVGKTVASLVALFNATGIFRKA